MMVNLKLGGKLLDIVKQFVPNAPFLYPMKISENRMVF